MNKVLKKTIAGVLTASFILAGVSIPLLVEAYGTAGQKTFSQQKRQMRKKQLSPTEFAMRISQNYGISSVTILKHLSAGVSMRDVNRAAFLSKAGGKSFEEVLAAKNANNTWKDVAAAFGITREQMKAARQQLTAKHLHARTGLSETVAGGLLQQGYKARDIAMAGILSRDTNKNVSEILSMKKINNTWRDVANSLGIDHETFMKAIHQQRKL